MKSLDFGRYVLCSCVAAAMLAACGGSEPTERTMPQALTPIARSRVNQASGSYGDLLYVATTSGITMVSYPQLEVVGTIATSADGGLCSDPNTGNVFVPQGVTVDEYAHGGTKPIATLDGPSGYTFLQGCSVNPTTGDLAMSSAFAPRGNGAIIVFPAAQGQARVYSDKILNEFEDTAYDSAGNLFAVAFTRKGYFRIGEIPAGQSQYIRIKLHVELGKIQWDGTYLAGEAIKGQGLDYLVYRLTVNGDDTTVVDTVNLKGAGVGGFCIYQGAVFEGLRKLKHAKSAALAEWLYPQGGKLASKLALVRGRDSYIQDVTLSVAPPR